MAALVALVVGAGAEHCLVRYAPVTPSATAALQFPTRVVELEGGLRGVLEQSPDFGSASAALLVNAGSAGEPAGKAGLAHLVEHLAFSATHAGLSWREWARPHANVVMCR